MWSPSKRDVDRLCREILDNIDDESDWGCHCRYCGTRILHDPSDSIRNEHSEDCPVPLANDIQTGIGYGR